MCKSRIVSNCRLGPGAFSLRNGIPRSRGQENKIQRLRIQLITQCMSLSLAENEDPPPHQAVLTCSVCWLSLFLLIIQSPGAGEAWELEGLEERPVLTRRRSMRSLPTLRLVFGRDDAREPDIALRHTAHYASKDMNYVCSYCWHF